MSNPSLGVHGESLVCDYLKSRGYQIIDRNFSRRGGEIDIIAKDKQSLLFVEVKTRSSKLIDPAYAITWAKQQKIIRTAKAFICTQAEHDYDYRFDVALIIQGEGKKAQLTYLEDAFQAEE